MLRSYSLLTKKLGRDVYHEWGRNEKLAKKGGLSMFSEQGTLAGLNSRTKSNRVSSGCTDQVEESDLPKPNFERER